MLAMMIFRVFEPAQHDPHANDPRVTQHKGRCLSNLDALADQTFKALSTISMQGYHKMMQNKAIRIFLVSER